MLNSQRARQNNQDNYPIMRPIWQFHGGTNYDGKADLKDVFDVGQAYNSVPGMPKWELVCDINHDLKIDLKDYYAVCKSFDKYYN